MSAVLPLVAVFEQQSAVVRRVLVAAQGLAVVHVSAVEAAYY